MFESGMIQNLFFPARGEKADSPAAEEKASAEAILVERVRAGDKNAFEELYRKFSSLVHGIVLARVPRDEVADIVQEVFITAYEKLHTLREAHLVSPWLASVARRRAVEFHRRSKPTVELSEDLSFSNDAKNEAREILDAIRELPETYSETLILRLVEGMTGAEIAEQTGMKHESVRVNLSRGMKLLRQKLGILE